MEEYSLNAEVTPGIHPYAQQKVEEFFYWEQDKIVSVFKTQWYVTKADHIKLGASEYNYMRKSIPMRRLLPSCQTGR